MANYVAEDIPFALVSFTSLEDQLGVPAPTIKGMATIACAAIKIDYWSKGLTMEKLGLTGKIIDEIVKYVNAKC